MRATDRKKRKLHSIPFDVFFHIVEDIDLSDFHNLSRTNRALYNLLQNDLLAKRTVQRHVRYSKEAQLAFAGKITFRQAISRLHAMRQAVASAKPYAVAVLSYATAFIYRDGVLSYMTNNEIRVLNVHRADQTEQVVDVQYTLRRIIPRFGQHEADGHAVHLSFLHYSSGILAILVEIADRNAWLILLDITPGGTKQPRGYRPGRLRFLTQLTCTRRLFVRHNGVHLFYGVNSIVDASGELLWAVHWADLTKDMRPLATRGPTILDKLAGTELGHNICFEIFDNHLYAVSNTINSDEETLNWRSFYEWVCIPPNCDQSRAQARRIWRRDHLEGPINDTWTEMSLRLDQSTGRPMILECRREWREGGSDHIRTYYAEPLRLPSELATPAKKGTQKEAEHAVAEPEAEDHPPPREPQRQSASFPHPLVTGGAGPSNINFATPPLPLTGPTEDDIERHRRSGRHVHSEYSAKCRTKHDYILARTKYRTYNLSACAFIDLVNDPEPNNRVGAATDRLRLRINARPKRKYVDNSDDNDRPAKRLHQTEDSSEPASSPPDEQKLSDGGIRLWPPDNADEELVKLLCPSRRAANIHAIADERSLIYSVDTNESGHQQAVILVSFDPQIRLPCMRSRAEEAAAAAAPTKRASSFSSSSSFVDIGLIGPGSSRSWQRRCSMIAPFPNSSSSSSPGTPSSKSSVHTELATHLLIDKGYWFDVDR